MTMNAEAFAPTVGSPLARIDGPLKVSGRAPYTADHRFPGMLYAVPVTATIAAGTLTSLDVSVARSMPGVQAVFTRENIGPLYRASKGSGAMLDERRPPLEDDEIRYYGQYIALVVADSFEQAIAATRAVKATYDIRQPDVSMTLSPDKEPSVDSERGDVDAAFAQGEVTLDQTYTTPPETHNPIELHSTLAAFAGPNYTLYETSQAVVNHKAVMVQMLGVAPENVRVITQYLGSGFGGKLWPWTHCVLAAAAARNLRRPIKLEITRQMMFQTVGHRTNTQQRIRLAATRQGRLTCLQQDFIYHVSRLDDNKENCGEATKYLYSTPNLRVTSAYARRDIGANTSMRGPGAVPGLYAVESAMNEMAAALEMDPLAFRLMNEPQIDESRNVPFSSRHLKECLQLGAERFGWHQRKPGVGSMQRDGMVLGWGMASASWMAKRIPATVSVSLREDGMAHVSCATQDLGTGTYTVLAQMVAQITELPLERIRVSLGDTLLPPGPISGGSMA
nr:xanthine dehydrogenase family protein molybdopterin-binding subunit [Pseudomonas sp.]